MESLLTNIITNLVNLKTRTYIFHWRTESYAEHKTAGEFIEELDKKTDEFVETCQGLLKNRFNFSKFKQTFKYNNISKKQLLQSINTSIRLLNRLDNKCHNSAILNIRDEIVGLLYHTIYLFTLQC